MKKRRSVLEEPATISFNKLGHTGKIFPTKELVEKTEYILIQTGSGLGATIIEHECDFVYYVLEGRGHFLIDDRREECKVGNLVVIPAGTKFTYKGRLKMLLVVSPPFWPEQEETM